VRRAAGVAVVLALVAVIGWMAIAGVPAAPKSSPTTASNIATVPGPAPTSKPASESGVAPGTPPAEPTLIMSLEQGYPRVRYPDGLASLNDRCIVKQSRLNIYIHPVYVNGMPISFCCSTCPGVFSADPEPWLAKQKIRVQDPIDRAKPAVLSKATRLFVGHDLYYFAGASTRARFEKSPLQYCGTLTDPVTRERFKPTAASPHLLRDGRDYWFASPESKARFAARPDSFAVRQGA
jgi:YHS domain-containing protein